jgi:hypothetical protein
VVTEVPGSQEEKEKECLKDIQELEEGIYNINNNKEKKLLKVVQEVNIHGKMKKTTIKEKSKVLTDNMDFIDTKEMKTFVKIVFNSKITAKLSLQLQKNKCKLH